MTAKIVLLIIVFVLSLALCLWLLLGRAPRRHRAFRDAQRLLEQGDWQQALDIVTALQAESRLSTVWQDRLRATAGESHQLAADQMLKEKHFEEALRHSLEAGARLGLDQSDQRTHIVEAMLAEARRLFAAGTESKETKAVLHLLERIFAVQSPCPEASFWQGLCLVRQQQIEPAMIALMAAHEQAGKQVLDPAFYLGVLLLSLIHI